MARAATLTKPDQSPRNEDLFDTREERGIPWPVDWAAIWVGALAAISAIFLFGLIGVAIGAHIVDREYRVIDIKGITLFTLGFSIFSAFLSFALGAWVATKVANITRADTAMLHGAIVWLVAVPILVVLIGMGAGSYVGGWYAGLAGSPSWATEKQPYQRPASLLSDASPSERAQYRSELAEYREKVAEWRENTPKATRNAALGAITALLLGLMGSALGGWGGSGEPMTLSTLTRDSRSPQIH